MLSSFVLKIIAVVSMLLDHVGLIMNYAGQVKSPAVFYLLRFLGRMAFPLYAFFLVNGFEKTHDRVKYLTRLCIFAVISQIPFTFATFRMNYLLSSDMSMFLFSDNLFIFIVLALAVAAYFLEGRKRKLLPLLLSAVAAIAMYGLVWRCHGYYLLLSAVADLNIFYTLGCSLAAIWVIDLFRNRKEYSVRSLVTAAVVCVAVCALFIGKMDYGWKGLLLIVLLYFFSGNKKMQALVTAAWSIVAELGGGLDIGIFLLYVAGTCAAAGGILLYSGEQGRKSRVFYYIYPVHLAIYGLIAHFILNG